jgi:hypothetical protein
MAAEITVIHRRVERLEEQGASTAGFAKEIDHLLMRVAEIEKHLGIDRRAVPRYGLVTGEDVKSLGWSSVIRPSMCTS